MGQLEAGESEVNADSEFKASWANIPPCMETEVNFKLSDTPGE